MTAAAQEPAPKHTGLKILVVVLGVLLVVGFFGLIVGVVYQVSHKAKKPAEESATADTASLPSFGDVTVPIHQGERIARIQPVGNRLFIELATVEGNSRLIVLDQATGKVLGTIAFPQEP
jgi:hypothetical protein